jgi:membrane protein DedA with SNARE-associated domain
VTAGTLHHLLSTYGYLAVFLFVAIESTGIPFPGETMLLTGAAYAGTGHLSIALVIGAAIFGAVLGDNLGYTVGRLGGRRVALRYGHFIRLDESKLDRAERFFQRHGDKTVFFGRFVAVLRAWAAFLAGVNFMPWGKFFFFNAAGGICWATLYGTLAFYFGKKLSVLEGIIRDVGFAGLGLVVVAAIVLFFLHRRAAHLSTRLLGSDAEPTGAVPAAAPTPIDKDEPSRTGV